MPLCKCGRPVAYRGDLCPLCSSQQQAPPAPAEREMCPKCGASAPLGQLSALRRDNGQRECIGCRVRLVPAPSEAAGTPPGFCAACTADTRPTCESASWCVKSEQAGTPLDSPSPFFADARKAADAVNEWPAWKTGETRQRDQPAPPVGEGAALDSLELLTSWRRERRNAGGDVRGLKNAGNALATALTVRDAEIARLRAALAQAERDSTRLLAERDSALAWAVRWAPALGLTVEDAQRDALHQARQTSVITRAFDKLEQRAESAEQRGRAAGLREAAQRLRDMAAQWSGDGREMTLLAQAEWLEQRAAQGETTHPPRDRTRLSWFVFGVNGTRVDIADTEGDVLHGLPAEMAEAVIAARDRLLAHGEAK